HEVDRHPLPSAGRSGPGRAPRRDRRGGRLLGLEDQRLRHRGQRERRRRFGLPVTLAPDELMAAAESETGLTDYGSDSFRPGLEHLTDALEHEAQLTELGHDIMRMRLVGHLPSRLQVQDTVKQHPEIEEEEIRSPLFIIGLPRTGTTALSNLLHA